MDRVELSRRAQKDLRGFPIHVAVKLKAWVDIVELQGLAAARIIPGFHDEPLKGQRKGQRSVRLSRVYRAFYSIQRSGSDEVVTVLEINKHDY